MKKQKQAKQTNRKTQQNKNKIKQTDKTNSRNELQTKITKLSVIDIQKFKHKTKYICLKENDKIKIHRLEEKKIKVH
jgi:hypothetical protein